MHSNSDGKETINMSYKITLTDGSTITLQCNPSIKDSTLLLFSLSDKSLLASYSAGQWRSIIQADLQLEVTK